MLMKQEIMEWQWHQLNYMLIICTLLQTDNNASISRLVSTGRMLFLMPDQQRQSTEGNCTERKKTCKRIDKITSSQPGD